MVNLRTRQLTLPASEGSWEALTIKEWHAERLKQSESAEILDLGYYTILTLKYRSGPRSAHLG